LSSPDVTTPEATAPNPCRRELAIEIPAADVQKETDAVVRKYSKLARIPGFRKGKVPANVVRSRFAEDIKNEVIEALIPRAFRAEVEKQKLEPVSQPQVTDLKLEEGEPLRFKAAFDVLPVIEVSGYQELRPEKPETTVSDDEVNTALNNLREQAATYQTVDDRAAATGDFVEVSFTGHSKDDEAAPPLNVEDILVEVGGDNTVKEFSEKLSGAKAGDDRTFDVAYAQDFGDQRLAGKTITYNVKVKSVKQKQKPELDDAFAKEVGNFENVDALRARVREQLEHEKKHSAEHALREMIVDELVKKNDFPVPDSLIDRQVDVRLERGLRALAAQGMRTEDMRKLDFERLRAGQRDAAVREVKASLILEKIADQEKIDATDADVDKEISIIAAQAQQSPEQIRARLTKEGALDRIRDRIRNDKALEFLLHRSA
jgi:trigger factor